MKNKFIYLVLIAAGFASCEPEIENKVDANYTSGDADFSSYVAIGNSLTAGYMDGTVSRVGQTYSFPNTLAGQFALVGGGDFTQPSFAEDVDNLGGILGVPGFGNRLIINASVGGPQPIAGTSTIMMLPSQATAYNNMGVPGAKSFHLLSNTYGNPGALPNANPYFIRHATSTSATVLGDAMSKNPTFFTNWIGNNDILSYATSGGVGVDQTGNYNPATYGPNDITDPTVFDDTYNYIINTLTSGAVPAKGVVATIPSVTAIPYFTTVPYAPLTAQSIGKGLVPAGSDVATQIDAGAAAMGQLNAQLYGPLKNIFTAYGEPNRLKLLDATKANPILINDEIAFDRSAQITAALTPSFGAPTAAAFGAIFGKCRQATSGDLVVLPASSAAGGGIGATVASVPSLVNKNGISYPMADKWVLIPSERTAVANATAAYNNAIISIAASKGIAVADMNLILNQLVNGLRVEDSTIYTANYFSSATASTVLFSLDGVHPNARGYAVISNEIIKVINSYYHANIPLVSAAGFPGATILTTN